VGVTCSHDSLINITISMLLFSVNFYPEASVLASRSRQSGRQSHTMRYPVRSLLVTIFLGLAALAARPILACPSAVTLKIDSSNYSGLINIEFRQGRRPGSMVVRRDSIDTRGTVTVDGVCAGTYFFAFSTPKDEVVSVTRYFDVINDGTSYSNPTLTVLYSRSVSGGQKVGSAKKSEL